MNSKKDKYDLDTKAELDNISGKLSGLNKNNPFSTPKDYFDELPQKIKEGCFADDRKPFLNMVFKSIFQPKYAIGFSILFIAILSVAIIFSNNDHNSSNNEFSEISWEDILNADPFFFADYSESELITTLVSQTNEDLNLLTPSSEENVYEEDLIEFLSNEDYEIEILYNL
ncbi:MAG: hypothetical protein JEY97_08335 [Bacteroidales bacterium]|nr:hypothetical protein [Bacteroidales bacterium]